MTYVGVLWTLEDVRIQRVVDGRRLQEALLGNDDPGFRLEDGRGQSRFCGPIPEATPVNILKIGGRKGPKLRLSDLQCFLHVVLPHPLGGALCQSNSLCHNALLGKKLASGVYNPASREWGLTSSSRR